PRADGEPSKIEVDSEGYTVWTYEYPDTWCVMYSRIRWPFDLGGQDPSDLSETSLRLTFSEQPYVFGEQGEPLYSDPTWAVALNGKPGAWTDGSFTGEWNIIGAISTEPTWWPYSVPVEQEIPFDYSELIDGENNLWFQQQDFCHCSGLEDCACTCYELSKLQLRAMVKLGVKSVSPAPDAQNVRVEQGQDSEIRVAFTTLVSPTTVNAETFQVSYYDQDLGRVPVEGQVRQLSPTEFAFVPGQALKDGIRYEVQVWDEDEALGHGRDQWVTDLSGGPLETGRIWSFWTMPQLEVKLTPVQVLEFFNDKLIQNKATALKTFVRWDLDPDVFLLDQLTHVEVHDIALKWQLLGNPETTTVHWNSGDAYGWQPARDASTARRKREYREYTYRNDAYTRREKMFAQDSVNYYGFMPRETGQYLLTAEVKLLDNHGKAVSFSDSHIPQVLASRRLDVRMRAVAVGADDGKTGVVDLSKAVNLHLNGVKAIFPVSSVSRPASPGAMPWYAPTTTLWAYSWGTTPVWPYILPYKYLLQEMDQLCQASTGCRAMVGLVDRGWLKDLGLTLREAAPTGALVEYNSTVSLYRFVAAHEIGHLTGIDEHKTQPGGEGLDVARKTDQRNSVDPTIDYMHVDPALPNLWIADSRYFDLLEWTGGAETAGQAQLRASSSSAPLLLAGGTITQSTGEVRLLPWYELDPGPWEAPVPGPYELVFLDASGQEIVGYSQPFTVAATLRPAGNLAPTVPLTDDVDLGFFSLQVPYPLTTTARVQIRHGETVLAEIVPGASAPDVSIDPPGSATWSGPQALTWHSDAGTRYFAVSVSTDGGATWEALALNLTTPAYTLETASLPDTAQALVRVAATDGLRTTTDTAGPFVVDNPPAVASVTPSPGAGGVGVWEPVVVGFRDAMDPASINGSAFTLIGGPFGAVTGTITYDAETLEATFTPHTALAFSTTYTASLTTGVRDAAGEALPLSITWTFTTEADLAAPRPSAFSPPAGALNVSTHTQLAVVWDQDLQASTVNSHTFKVAIAGGASISGTLAYDAATRSATFTPASSLTAGTLYTVTLDAGIQDSDGNATEAAFDWAFRTGHDAAPVLAFSGAYADDGQDTDGDGLFDRLVIQVGVQVTATGNYILRGTLADASGAEITWAQAEATLAPGVHFLDLRFDGTSIGGHGVDGPYTLTDLTLVHTAGTLPLNLLATVSAHDAYRTSAYAAAQFPAPLSFSSLPDVVLIPGTTSLDAFNVYDYASHVLSPSEQLSYTLMRTTATAAGVELLPTGDVRVTPDSYWRGSADVTLRATDGVYVAQDTFNVLVGWPRSLYLPLALHNSDAANVPADRSALVTFLEDDFESESLGWSRYSWISGPPDGPGGWYHWARRDCAAHSGQYSVWPYGDGEDGELLSCGAEYPNTLSSTMYKAIPANLKYVAQGEYKAKVWTNLAPGAQVCLNVAVIESESCEGGWGAIGDYYGVCRSGQTSGWEDLTLDLANVPVLGSVLGQEHVCLAVNFWGGATGTRPEGTYVDDVSLQVCPEGLTEYCEPSARTVARADAALVTGSIGGYTESVDEAALAVEAGGRIHALWTGKLNPNFNDYVFYSTSPDGVNWTPYQILNYWGGREPRIAVDDVHQVVHLAYASNYDGVIHHTVVDGVPSAPAVVAPRKTYYLPGFPLSSGGVAWPSIAVAEETGYAYLLWREAYWARVGDTYSLRYRTWHAYWDGSAWSAPLRKINDQDTSYSSIAAAPDDRVMMAWFQRWQQSSGGGLGPGDPIVARTAYGETPGSFPLRQATHALYPEPERDESIVLAYSGGDDAFVLASDHAMWPGHSRVYRYLWQDGVWSEPLDVAQNTDGWASPRYVGAAADQALIYYVYNQDGLYFRTESDGVLSAPQSMANYLAVRGYTGSPLAFFVAEGLHVVVSGTKDGGEGFYYVQP
ncbi:MAG: Ig-like domain-containing protein, partial [Anaerolineae bacterium]